MFTGYSTVGCRFRITVGVGMFLLSLFIMDSCVSFPVSPIGVFFRGNVGWSVPGGFVDML